MCARSRSTGGHRPSPIEKFDVTLTVGDRDFTFPLNCQLRNLATDIQITYYWIDHRLLRETTLNQAHNVCRRIVDYWEQVLFLHDPSRAHSPSEVLVLAHAFRVLSRKKKMHQVFRDATLRPLPPRGSDFRDRAIDLRWAELADDVRQRIEAVVVQRDSNAVRRECAFIFGWNPPSSIELALLNQAYDQWVERAVELYRSRPEAGIEQFVDEFCRTESRLRRSGRTSFIARRFLDLMMFESKVSFYECYAVLWQGLIPWLRVNRNLDAVSEKFLRLWHNQNPSIRRAVANGVERFEADAFFGHVLSLHPLSGILMNSPGLCEQTATYFRISNEETTIRTDTAPPSEYWNLVRAILMAGHIYRLNDVRTLTTTSLDAPTPQSAAAAPFSREQGPSNDAEIQDGLRKIAQLVGLYCQTCGSELTRFRCTELDSSNRFRLTGHCAHCRTDSQGDFDLTEFRDELLPPESE